MFVPEKKSQLPIIIIILVDNRIKLNGNYKLVIIICIKK